MARVNVTRLEPRRIGGRTFDFANRTAIMAVVNRTPDSFYDNGATFALETAVRACESAAEAGADWVDIGGVPFSPDTPEVSVTEEIDRVVPVVEAIAANTDVVISVDTFRAEVARAAIEAGAGVINDVTGLRFAGGDAAGTGDMAGVVAGSAAAIVLAHSAGKPHRHLRRPTYADVVTEIVDFLRDRVSYANSRGIPDERIIVDAGHDLNKNTYHSLEITRRLDEITALGLPTLAALSNKDFVGETLDRPQGERMFGSLAAAVLCVERGARILRVHNVAETRDVVRMTESVLGLREPAYTRHNIDPDFEPNSHV